MRFNQVIWDVLVWAHRDGNGEAYRAMEEYAAEHDGQLFVSTAALGETHYGFVPNPIPKY